MSKQYFCEKCQSTHRMSSKIGMKHRGIEVEEPKRKTYVYTFPDGTTLKTTSVYNYTHVAVSYKSTHTSYVDDSTSPSGIRPVYSAWKWCIDYYTSEERARERESWFKEKMERDNPDVKEVYVVEVA